MTTLDASGSGSTPGRSGARPGRFLALRVLERNAAIGRHYWMSFVARLAEPFLFLFSIGIGVGALVDGVTGPAGEPITYRAFVAPAMVASSAMNAAVFATSAEFFSKFKWVGSFEAMLASPIRVVDLLRGELIWILGYVGLQSAAFTLTMLAMGLIESWWAVLLVPAAVLVAFAFAGAGFTAASFLRTWFDFEYITVVVFPMFLFSASFFPLDRYPETLQWVVRLVPLYHGVDLTRDLTFGTVDWWSLVSVAYLVVMGLVGLRLAVARLGPRLQP